GNRDGEEVVQLYVSGQEKTAPVRSLKGFQRIYLKKGESRTVQFNLKPEDLATMNNNGQPMPMKGKILISVGGCQPGEGTVKTKQTVQGSLQF
ncbi:MAG TPA: fibronectin type III-like domain-contianing protein, partial [Flavisolibacter sp.]|nr:fibronectin type III-like domain-contianing protein [Flavisolibacter sp.]